MVQGLCSRVRGCFVRGAKIKILLFFIQFWCHIENAYFAEGSVLYHRPPPPDAQHTFQGLCILRTHIIVTGLSEGPSGVRAAKYLSYLNCRNISISEEDPPPPAL